MKLKTDTRWKTTRQLHVLTTAGRLHSNYPIKFRAILLVRPLYTVLIYSTHEFWGLRLSRVIGVRISGQFTQAEIRKISNAGRSGSGTLRIRMSSIRTITNTRHGLRILAIDTFGRAHLYHFAVTRLKGG